MRFSGPTRVLIVDDSPSIRATLVRVLGGKEDIQVIGGAKDAAEARDLILAHRPDVIVLDIEMPGVSGLSFLRKLMIHYPVPVIMCAEPTPAGHDSAIRAIEMGAVEVITKPHGVAGRLLEPWSEDLVHKIRAAAASRPAPPPLPPVAAGPTLFRDAGLDPSRYLVLIGASTGGTEALKRLLRAAPPDFPPIAIVQHMPEGFTAAFARHLNQDCAMEISETVDGDMLTPGKAFLARGGTQMRVVPATDCPRIRYGESTPVNRHCPSVDVLFDSALRVTNRKLIGVILTGMGADGAHGLLRLRQAGALTIGQDQQSCVVYGMPKVAADLGAVQIQCGPAEVPRTILNAIRNAHAHRAARAAT